MAPNAIKYTLFVTPLGQFEFLKMPFELKIGPQRFQRFINEVMTEVIQSGNVIVYMDNILIATETIGIHLDTLRRVFELLVQNKLELRPEKFLSIH